MDAVEAYRLTARAREARPELDASDAIVLLAGAAAEAEVVWPAAMRESMERGDEAPDALPVIGGEPLERASPQSVERAVGGLVRLAGDALEGGGRVLAGHAALAARAARRLEPGNAGAALLEARAEARAGGLGRCVGAAGEASRLSREVGDAATGAAAELVRGIALSRMGRADEGGAALREAHRLCGRAGMDPEHPLDARARRALEELAADADDGNNDGNEEKGHGRLPGRYPSTPHLPFSPAQLADDDTALPSAAAFCGAREVVVTEKMDGGNCCLHAGRVYARTHARETARPWFGPTKAAYASFVHQVPAHLALFGENMTAVHAIEYEGLRAHFYLFAVLDTAAQRWLAWDDVEAAARRYGLRTVPVLRRGAFASPREMREWMDARAARPSATGGAAPAEGFVVRDAASFGAADLSLRVAKYVRASHTQKEPDFARRWRRAAVLNND